MLPWEPLFLVDKVDVSLRWVTTVGRVDSDLAVGELLPWEPLFLVYKVDVSLHWVTPVGRAIIF